MSRETRKRVRRTPGSSRNILNVRGKEPGYVYRVVNDTGDRVEQFQAMGYEIVCDDKVQVGDRRIANPTKEGSPVLVHVGGGVKAYLMRQKKEYYDEDQQDKANHLDAIEKGIKRGADANADYGKVKVETVSED